MPLIDNTIEHRSEGLSSNGDEIIETNNALRTQGEDAPKPISVMWPS